MSIQTAGMIDVTGVPLEALVRAAYAPSRQQGLGFLDPTGSKSELSDEEVKAIIARGADDRLNAISIDYLRGRSVKFDVRKIGGRHYIKSQWYDHSDAELRNLLRAVGLSDELVDKARSEKAAYDEDCFAAAMEHLKANDGSIIENGWVETEKLPSRIYSGLWIGHERGATKEEYLGDGKTKWSLSAAG